MADLCCSRPLSVSLTHTHPFNGRFSGTTQVSRNQKGKTNLDFTKAIDSEWQWHQPGNMQVCTSLQTDNHTSIPPLSSFTGRMPFLPPNQQRQSTEGSVIKHTEYTRLAETLMPEDKKHVLLLSHEHRRRSWWSMGPPNDGVGRHHALWAPQL